MRIAYVSADSGVPVFGTNGSSSHVQSVLAALLAKGAAIELFASRFDGDPPAPLAGIRRHKLPRPSRRLPQAEREARAIAANADLAGALLEAGPFDLVYERQSLWSAAGMTAATALGIPGLLEVNAPLLEETARYRSLVDRAAAERQVRRTLEAASAVLAVSSGVARHLEGFAEAAGKVHLVANGVDPARFTPASSGRDLNATPTVGFVGSLRPWHGLETLLDATRLLRDRGRAVRLLIVGKGPEQPALIERTKRLDLTAHVTWTGALRAEAVPAQLARMDVATAPYPALDDFYFSPLKVFEYMAAGLPVVASRIGDLPTLIEHGRTGWLCRPGDVPDLADAIDRLIADPALRHRLGQAARRTVEARHGWDRVADRILAIASRASAGLERAA